MYEDDLSKHSLYEDDLSTHNYYVDDLSTYDLYVNDPYENDLGSRNHTKVLLMQVIFCPSILSVYPIRLFLCELLEPSIKLDLFGFAHASLLTHTLPSRPSLLRHPTL